MAKFLNEKGYILADIPKNCEECDYARLINGEMACTAANLRRKTKKEKPEWCPIQPIPEREDNDKEEKEMMKIKENTHKKYRAGSSQDLASGRGKRHSARIK